MHNNVIYLKHKQVISAGRIHYLPMVLMQLCCPLANEYETSVLRYVDVLPTGVAI